MAESGTPKAPPAGSEPLTGRDERIAFFVADDDLSDAEIAQQTGVSERTLYRLKRRPDFAARVLHLREEIRAEIRARGIAVKENRVRALHRRARRLERVIAERAAAAEREELAAAPEGWHPPLVLPVPAAPVPGFRSGALARDYKSLGSGDQQRIVPVYEFDAALWRELREIEKQAAQEMGQWVSKEEVTGTIIYEVTQFPCDDDVDAGA